LSFGRQDPRHSGRHAGAAIASIAPNSHYRERRRIAEEWLQRIQHEIEDKLIAPQAGSPAD
jgi:hypothetical protein